MDNKYLLTVFLITYNHVETFDNAINSVLAQKTNFPFKIVILDDASTDGTSDLVRKYANIPHVFPVIREVNSCGSNFYLGLLELDTKYYAVLETDDCWCDENKLQMQFDIMEANPDCSFCAHNTLVNFPLSGTSKKYLDVPTRKYIFPPEKLTSRYYIEPHTSSKMLRSECLDLENIKNPLVAVYDIANNFYYSTKGNLYYIDKIMSVYNYNERGIYSGISSYEQRFKSANVVYEVNKELGFKYNKLLSRFFSTRINLFFVKYWILKFTGNKECLIRRYEKILADYAKKYLNKREKKPIFQLSLPFRKNASLVLELRREKDRV